MILSAFENRLRVGSIYNTPCKQIQPLSWIKTLNGRRVRRISPVGKEKVYGGNDLPKSMVAVKNFSLSPLANLSRFHTFEMMVPPLNVVN